LGRRPLRRAAANRGRAPERPTTPAHVATRHGPEVEVATAPPRSPGTPFITPFVTSFITSFRTPCSPHLRFLPTFLPYAAIPPFPPPLRRPGRAPVGHGAPAVLRAPGGPVADPHGPDAAEPPQGLRGRAFFPVRGTQGGMAAELSRREFPARRHRSLAT